MTKALQSGAFLIIFRGHEIAKPIQSRIHNAFSNEQRRGTVLNMMNDEVAAPYRQFLISHAFLPETIC